MVLWDFAHEKLLSWNNETISVLVVAASYKIAEYKIAHKKVKFVTTLKVAYKMALLKDFQSLVFLKCTFLNAGSHSNRQVLTNTTLNIVKQKFV